MSLRRGITTGTCAAAAAKAAAVVLCGGAAPEQVEIALPGQTASKRLRVPIERIEASDNCVTATVRKDAGDDPDITHRAAICATVGWHEGDAVLFAAGEGVGTVTRAGLQLPPGQPAINPGPRQMIASAVREVTPRGVLVTVAIPGGRELALKTFNPRLGIEGGLSILGTTGIVRPYCRRAIRETLRCQLDVAAAAGLRRLAFVPGNIGAKAAKNLLNLKDDEILEVGNAWDALRELSPGYRLETAIAVGHPGKLAKLATGDWDTHSSRSPQAVDFVARLCGELTGIRPESPTVEGIFNALPAAERTLLGSVLAARIRTALAAEVNLAAWSVVLVDMTGTPVGSDGDAR